MTTRDELKAAVASKCISSRTDANGFVWVSLDEVLDFLAKHYLASHVSEDRVENAARALAGRRRDETAWKLYANDASALLKADDHYRATRTPPIAGAKVSEADVERVAWKMALADGRDNTDHLVASTRLVFGMERYKILAKAAITALTKEHNHG